MACYFRAALNAIYRIVKAPAPLIGSGRHAPGRVLSGHRRYQATANWAEWHGIERSTRRAQMADGTVSVHDNGTIASRPPP